MTATAIFAYVGTYTRPGKSEGIHVYRMDPSSGALSHLETVPSADPSFLAFDAEQRRLYAVNEVQDDPALPKGEVSAFAIDAATGRLRFLNRQPAHGSLPCHLVVDPSGRYLIVANYGTGNLPVYPIGPDGQLGPASDIVQHTGSGPHERQRGPHAHAVVFDPPGCRLLAADLGIDRVLVYRLDDVGKLVPNDLPAGNMPPGSGPRHVAFHPNGRYVYVNGEIDSTVTAFRYDDERGVLEPIHTLSTLPEGFQGRNSTAEIQVAPSGRFVYVSNRGHDSIAIFSVEGSTGRLLAQGHESTRGQTPRNFAIDPSGAHLYAANQNSDTIVHFRVDQESGRLEASGQVIAVPSPVCVVFRTA